jgi:hypothetical protein
MEKRESKIVERNSPSSILDPNPRTHRAAQARVDEISEAGLGRGDFSN